MKRLIPLLCFLTLGGAAFAAGWSATHSLCPGPVVVSNSQANATWTPVAALFRFDAAANPTITITRVSAGTNFLLRLRVDTNVTDLIWIPEARFPFGQVEALQISSSATNGTVQIIREAGDAR